MKYSGYQTVRTAYWVIKGSGVRSVNSCWMALEGLHELLGKRCKEFLGDGESALGKSNGAFLGATRL